jgi:hypothetical protein
MVGAPIQRNREWIIQDYLNHLYRLDYPKEEIHLSFFINGAPMDRTGEYIFEFKEKFEHQYARCDIWTMDDENDDSDRALRDYNHFAHIRNLWLSMRRKSDTHVFSVDSDIIISPNTLRQLMSHNLDIVGAPVINFSCPVGSQYNFLFEEPFSQAKSGERTYSSGTEPLTELTKVDATGACILIKRDVLDQGAFYGYHYQGEDIFFCQKAQQLGFKIYVDPLIKTKHYRERKDYENHSKML